jgi:curved DNA-binding protein CbpA
LLAKEALDVLGLGSGATPLEIKEAYRDLVKVWHPDRFGSDARLRRKAEDKLKQIINAYMVLQSDHGKGGTHTDEPEKTASSIREGAASPRSSSSSPVPKRARTRWNRGSISVGWLYGCVGISLGLMAGYVALEHGSMPGARSSTGSVEQVEAASEQGASKTAGATTPGVLAVPNDPSAELPGRKDQPKSSGRATESGAGRYQVRLLSGAQTAQVEAACASQRELPDQTAYRHCLKAQLDLVTEASREPDLSALNGAEHESITSACSEAKRLHGTDGYNRCLTAQMAQLAAEPARPDLSGLSEADRSSIEAACKKAKNREGPSAYNRCRLGLIKLLAESK